MKSSTRDRIEGKLHLVKGAIKEAVGKVTGNQGLEFEGKNENIKGKIQGKIGHLKKVVKR